MAYLESTLKQERYTVEEIEELEIVEFIDYASEWIERTPAPGAGVRVPGRP